MGFTCLLSGLRIHNDARCQEAHPKNNRERGNEKAFGCGKKEIPYNTPMQCRHFACSIKRKAAAGGKWCQCEDNEEGKYLSGASLNQNDIIFNGAKWIQ